MAGAAVYAWHCDREGRYSLYSEGAEDENYLRGISYEDNDVVGRMALKTGKFTGDWTEKVYKPEIVAKPDTLYKKPGYEPH